MDVEGAGHAGRAMADTVGVAGLQIVYDVSWNTPCHRSAVAGGDGGMVEWTSMHTCCTLVVRKLWISNRLAEEACMLVLNCTKDMNFKSVVHSHTAVACVWPAPASGPCDCAALSGF